MIVHYVLQGPCREVGEDGMEYWWNRCIAVEDEEVVNITFHFESEGMARKFIYDVNYNMEGLNLDEED